MDMTNANIASSVLRVREALIKAGFWDQANVERFVTLFQNYIEILKYEYDPVSCTISIKVKKTAVRKIPNFRPEAYFYYDFIGSIMMILLRENKERVIRCLEGYRQTAGLTDVSVYDIYFAITSNPIYLYNLVNVQCIMDNFIQIIL